MKSFVLTILSAITLVACNSNGSKGKNNDSATSGSIVIGVDESYIPLMDTQIFTFEALYKDAKIQAIYKPEAEIILDLINDSLRLAVIGRDLTEKEREFFKKQTHPAYVTQIAVDAVALIGNLSNTDTLLTMGQVKRILLGQDSLWSQIDKTSKLGAINVVFDNNGSANYRYLKEEVLKGQNMGPGVYAKNSNAEVIEYVANNKNAIGVISVSWISDHKDSLALSFLSKINVLGISEFEDPIDNSDYKKPYQAYIYNESYPMRRNVYVVKLGTRSGLGTGFAAHLAGEKGQLIIHKAGMVAAQAPTRLIQMKQD